MHKDGWSHDAKLEARIAECIGPKSYEMWFPHHARLGFQDAKLVVVSDSSFLRDLVKSNMDADLLTATRQLLGDAATVEYVVAKAEQQQAVAGNAAKQPLAIAAEQCPGGESGARKSSLATDREASVASREVQSFANFVLGEANRFAFEVARQVAARGSAGNSVTLIGPCGSGKSHLLSAIRDEHRKRFPQARVLLLTAEQFTTCFLSALNGGGLPNFRHKHRDVDLLIIDNLPFFLGKRATIEELQYTVDRVISGGGQVVVTSARPLGELSDLGNDLLSRFHSGLVCDLELPDRAARRAIIGRLFAKQQTDVSDDVVGVLASGLATGVREIMGVVNRLATQHRLLGDPIDRQLAERIVTQANRHTRRPVKLNDIERAVCDFFGVDGKRLRSDDRHRTVSQPRMLAMWLARKYTQSAWREIGDFFGGRSHSTVISAHRQIEKQLGRDGQLKIAGRPWHLHEAVQQIESALQAG